MKCNQHEHTDLICPDCRAIGKYDLKELCFKGRFTKYSPELNHKMIKLLVDAGFTIEWTDDDVIVYGKTD